MTPLAHTIPSFLPYVARGAHSIPRSRTENLLRFHGARANPVLSLPITSCVFPIPPCERMELIYVEEHSHTTRGAPHRMENEVSARRMKLSRFSLKKPTYNTPNEQKNASPQRALFTHWKVCSSLWTYHKFISYNTQTSQV